MAGKGREGRGESFVRYYCTSRRPSPWTLFSSVHDFIAPQKGVAATGDAHEAAALLHRGGIVL